MTNRVRPLWRLNCGLRRLLLLCLAGVLASLSACNNSPKTTRQEDADIQRRSAEATEKLKAGAEKAAVVAQAASVNAERRLNDVAKGVKQGLGSDDSAKPGAKPPAGRVDVNTASARQLANLPGMSMARADAVVAGRPYSSPHQLVKKGIVSAAEFQRISGRLTAR